MAAGNWTRRRTDSDAVECRAERGIYQRNSVAPRAAQLQDSQCCDRIERSELGSEYVQESTSAAAHERGAAGGQLHGIERKRRQRDVVSAQLQRKGRAGGAEHVSIAAEGDF